MTYTTAIIFIIFFTLINYALARKIKDSSIDKRSIKFFHILFFCTVIIDYLLNTRYVAIRFNFYQYNGGFVNGVSYLVKNLIIEPYSLILLTTLFILAIFLIFNRLLIMWPFNFYINWSKALRNTIICAYVFYWYRFILIELFKFGIRSGPLKGQPKTYGCTGSPDTIDIFWSCSSSLDTFLC